MRRIVALLLIVAAALGLAWVFGPRVAVDTTVTFDPSAIGNDPDAYLAQTESRFADIREGLAKEIVWAFPASRAKTPLAIVYVHGFSASKGEIRPVPDRVAKALGANLFFTRLAGHGRSGEAMAEATVNAWINDYAEAVAIGRAIGEQVVVIGVSTGASIAAWAAQEPALSQGIAGLVMISPNFGPQAAGSDILTMPWGGTIAELIAGKERGFEPDTRLQAHLWTTRYPTRATLPMAAVVKLANDRDPARTELPALFILSDADKVVRPERSRMVAERWGGPARLIAIEDSGDASMHVIAGEAYSPSTTERVAADITDWIRGLPQ